jgi:tetratricopeptide (TPR) repeat protein
MIAYVLVMLVSLSTGLPTHASLEGPMARDWCEQLIRQDRYVGADGTNRRQPACLSEAEVRRALLASYCTRHPGPSPRWPSIEFDCAAPASALAAADEERAASPEAGSVAADSPPEERATASEPLAPTEPTQPPQPTDLAQPPASIPSEPPSLERQFHLGTAASALVTRAHAQAQHGEYGPAAATIERALRIEPDNPLLWIELGQIRMGEGQPAQADGLYRKALALAAGDGQLQASAWKLIAESLRARGRQLEAAEAESRAAAATLR